MSGMKWVRKTWFQIELEQLKPILSVGLIVTSLMIVVFFQMEERRLGYGILKYTRDYKEKLEERRLKEISLARSMRLDKVEKLAQRRTSLRRTEINQVIYLNEESRSGR